MDVITHLFYQYPRSIEAIMWTIMQKIKIIHLKIMQYLSLDINSNSNTTPSKSDLIVVLWILVLL